MYAVVSMPSCAPLVGLVKEKIEHKGRQESLYSLKCDFAC